MDIKNRVRRFDIATILETAFINNEWKGDEHHKGVFFTDDKGYCVNKVLAVRAYHEEQAPKVFYSFLAKSIDEKVTIDFPFAEMNVTPKKHHLLFNDKTMTEELIDDLFSIDEAHSVCEVTVSDISSPIVEVVPNKRERDRTQVHFTLSSHNMNFAVVREKKSEQIIHYEKANVCNVDWNGEKGSRNIKVNANTLFTVMNLFSEKTKVSFQFAHDRMKITGCLSTKEERTARVEVVLSLLKA